MSSARSDEWGHEWGHGPVHAWGPAGYRPAFWFWHPGWIVLMVLGFVLWWPVGLAVLAFTLWGRRMSCWGWGSHGYEQHWQEKMERMRAKMERFGHCGWAGPSSGNRAFDEYRTETLRRLEEEQREFREFLQRLRMAKDKAEFDQFMAERRNRPEAPPQS
jgi:alpha-beta hydrolase superfamily lysophospholipase